MKKELRTLVIRTAKEARKNLAYEKLMAGGAFGGRLKTMTAKQASPFDWRASPPQINWSAGAKSHRQTLIDATRQNGESTLGWAAKSTVQTPAPRFQKKRKRS